jgi:HK97 family phage prohead protease
MNTLEERLMHNGDLYRKGIIRLATKIERDVAAEREYRNELRQRGEKGYAEFIDVQIAAAEQAAIREKRMALQVRSRTARPGLAMQFKSAGCELCYSTMEFKAARSPAHFDGEGPDQGDSRFSRTSSADVGVPPGDARFGAKDDDGDLLDVYGMVWNVTDRQDDIALPGCVSNIDEFLRDGWISWSHQNQCLPVGIPVSAVDDGKGFRVSAQWHDTPEAQECRTVCQERLKAGKRMLSSVGYVVHDAEPRKQGGQVIRALKSISVFEVSLALFVANPAAAVVSA